jgi:hypothetical protein
MKAGFVEAPCTLLAVTGRDLRDVAMQVVTVERTIDETTFVGRGLFAKGLTRLTVENGTWVQVR